MFSVSVLQQTAASHTGSARPTTIMSLEASLETRRLQPTDMNVLLL